MIIVGSLFFDSFISESIVGTFVLLINYTWFSLFRAFFLLPLLGSECLGGKLNLTRKSSWGSFMQSTNDSFKVEFRALMCVWCARRKWKEKWFWMAKYLINYRDESAASSSSFQCRSLSFRNLSLSSLRSCLWMHWNIQIKLNLVVNCIINFALKTPVLSFHSVFGPSRRP